VIDREGSKTDVKVHQLAKTLSGDVLSDTDVRHVTMACHWSTRPGISSVRAQQRTALAEAPGRTGGRGRSL